MEKFEKFSIDAVHSISRRVIKHNLSFNEFKSLLLELVKFGYEDIQVDKCTN